MKKIYAGLIGFGNIGTGVVRLLDMNRGLIEDRLGASIVLKKIADIDIETPRDAAVDRSILTADAADILKDPEISIVIELVGGYQPALSFMLEAIKAKKHVVTANKALLATYGDEVFRAAEREDVDIGFEASVGGTIPVIKALKECLVANRIKSVLGIMNGTSNYILTKMSDEGQAFAEVLKEAQRLGFAEADPTFDIEGIDTAHKLAIVLSLSYGKKVEIDSICREGISGIAQKDIEFAKELGYKIKLLAIARERGEEVEARIHPTMIPFNHLLANVNGNFNAFHFVGDASDSVFLYGQGSGMMPTASAVVSDLIDIARNILKGISRRVPARARSEETIEDIRLMPMEEIVTKYYFRFSAVDRPGVLSNISGVLGANDISI
ncbi:MAG: homoserine dehydrogenase, partial [Syntrophobacterales bacterium]|nr:homoserine dehydrogenase [Syntrophobacterales bacterium]